MSRSRDIATNLGSSLGAGGGGGVDSATVLSLTGVSSSGIQVPRLD